MNDFKKKINAEHIDLANKAASLDLSPADSLKLRKQILKAVAVTPQVKPVLAKELGYSKQARFVFIFRAALAAMVGILMVGGTVFASGFSKPGDLLYPVKMIKEAVEIKLAPTEKAKAMIEAKHAVARLQELSEIQAEAASSTNSSAVATSTPIAQAKQQADVQVNSAYRSLVQAQTDLQAKGQESSAIQATINSLEEKAKSQDIQINTQTEQIGPEHAQDNTNQTPATNRDNNALQNSQANKTNSYKTHKRDSGENNRSGTSTTTPSDSSVHHAVNNSGAATSTPVISTASTSASTSGDSYKIIQPENNKSDGEVKGTSTQQQLGVQTQTSTQRSTSGDQSGSTTQNKEGGQQEGSGTKTSGDD